MLSALIADVFLIHVFRILLKFNDKSFRVIYDDWPEDRGVRPHAFWEGSSHSGTVAAVGLLAAANLNYIMNVTALARRALGP